MTNYNLAMSPQPPLNAVVRLHRATQTLPPSLSQELPTATYATETGPVPSVTYESAGPTTHRTFVYLRCYNFYPTQNILPSPVQAFVYFMLANTALEATKIATSFIFNLIGSITSKVGEYMAKTNLGKWVDQHVVDWITPQTVEPSFFRKVGTFMTCLPTGGIVPCIKEANKPIPIWE